MSFHSILFRTPEDGAAPETCAAPACFGDLNLDQIIDTVIAGKQEYNLAPIFFTPLGDRDTIVYRQGVMRDLEDARLCEPIAAFTEQLRTMRRLLALADKTYSRQSKAGWLFEAASLYCDAVSRLVAELADAAPRSEGLWAFRAYLAGYARAEGFIALHAWVDRLRSSLASITYCLLIRDNSVTVRPYAGETDYSQDVAQTFAKFQQGAVKDYRVTLSASAGMSHVEAGILELVAKLYPDIFGDLDAFAATNVAFLDDTLRMFDREVQFYLAYLAHIAVLRQAGLPFCYPELTDGNKVIACHDAFDLALAWSLSLRQAPLVSNDVELAGPERILVVSGPNQGGKITFARMVGQLHYLASLGCPVPGRAARLALCDQIFTHFEQQERSASLDGKLQDDLKRVHAILSQATPQSLIILNEIFSSTTLSDALILGARVLETLMQLDARCVCVTFIDEWSRLSPQTVSLVSTVVPEDPTHRTFRIVRRPADGRAYALSIAEKYRLTYDYLTERIQP